MPLAYSYTDSAARLLDDARTLWEAGARETAAHAAGLSAECALKSVLIGLGLVTPAADGQLERGPRNNSARVHIDRLWGEFQARLAGHRGARYLALLPTRVPGPFDGWLVDHRYVAAGQLDGDDLYRWTWAAICVRSLLNEAISQGEAQ